MSRFIEFIRGKSDYSEFKEGEIKKIKNGCLLRKKKEIIMEIEVDGHTINKTISFYRNDARTKFYLFPKDLGLTEQNKNEKFLYNLICFKENMTVLPICTPIECTLEDLNALEGLKIPFLVSHRLTEKGEEVEYISLIEEVI